MVVIDGETSKLQACDKEALNLQRCLFKEDYDFSACKPYTEALQKCCRNFKVPLQPLALKMEGPTAHGTGQSHRLGTP
jgi:hypothetical protein